MKANRIAIVLAVIFYVGLWAFIVFANLDELMTDFVLSR